MPISPPARATWLLLLGLWGLPSAVAQPGSAGLDSGKTLSQYHHESWTTDDGLPQNTIRAIAQTRDGYLWVSTQEGIARFDGLTFEAFDKRTVPALQKNDVSSLLVDAAGVLWAGTNGGGLTRLEEGSFTTLTKEHGLASDHVGTLQEDRSGNLWIGTRNGLTLLSSGRFTTYTTEQGLTSNQIMTLLEDEQGTFWVGTASGLSHYEDGHFTSLEELEGLEVWTLAEDVEGALWIGTNQGLKRLYRGTLSHYGEADGLQGAIIYVLFSDETGGLWVGTERGLSRYRAGRFTPPAPQPALRDDIMALFQDREGSLWVGTYANGLSQLKDLKFTPFTTQEGLTSDEIWPIYEDRSGSLWVGTDRGLNQIRGGKVTTTYTEQDGLSSGLINALWEDHDGSLWIGTHSGLNRLRNGRIEVIATRGGLADDMVLALYEDRAGTLWIGTSEGLSRLTGGKLTRVDDGLSSHSVQAIHQDRSGRLWFGTSKALLRYEKGRFTQFTMEDGLSSNYIMALHEDADGTLWIATWGGGLNRYRDGTFTAFTAEDGLLNDNILQVLEDDHGYLWMTSNLGIFRVAKRELDAHARGTLETIPYTAFDKSDGLPSRECTGNVQPAGWRSRDGRLWFPTQKGLAMIDPAHIHFNETPPPAVITRVVANDMPVTEGTRLPAGQNKIAFHYTGLSFVAPQETQFHYQLEGVDDGWVAAGTRREAFYPNLSPGDYTFRVRAVNGDGVASAEAAAVSFYLEPFFYQTSWFYLLCALGVIWLGVGLFRLRVRQMRQRQCELEGLIEQRTSDLREEKEKTEQALVETEAARSEAERQKEIAEEAKEVIEDQADRLREMDRIKTRFFNNISHEFRTPLTLTIGPLENALTGTYGPVDGVLKKQLGIMLRNSRRLLRLINQLLDLSKLESGQLELRARHLPLPPFVECIVLSFTAFAEERGIDLQLELGEEDLGLCFDPEKLEKIIFNLLSNALKFTPRGGEVCVSITELSEAVEIRVRDSGPGIPEGELAHIFDRFHQVDGTVSQVQEGTGIGLSLVKELVELHGGKIEVESREVRGTEFCLTLPKGRAHLSDDQIAPSGAEEIGAVSRGSMVEMVAVDQDELGGDGQPLPAPSAEPTPPGAKAILVIDDNRDVRAYVRGCLQPRYRVFEASDGEEGLQQARNCAPDLILCDVMMPAMDGYELCRRVKTDDELRHIPIVLLTAKASIDMKLEGLALGADDYVAKPFNARELLARIGNLLTIREQAKELKALNLDLERKVQEQLETLLSERRRYEEHLIAAKDRAEASARLKSTILENMSHEIRTPITAIMGFSQVLAQEVEGSQQEFVSFIEENSQRLLDTLNAILDLSRIESDGLDLQHERCDVTEFVQRAATYHRPMASRKGITLHTQLPARPVTASLDSGALDRILHNLIGNAVKFTEEGEITVVLTQHAGEVHLEVRDTGIGIGEEFVPKVFEAFEQESAGLSRSHEGNGLGLSITQRLVHALGGRIEVESKQGVGSVFRVRLPLSASPPLRAVG